MTIEVTEPRRTDVAPAAHALIRDNLSLDGRKQLIAHQPWVYVDKRT